MKDKLNKKIRFNGEPGFTTESFEVLKRKVAETPNLPLSLMVDEMSLRHHIFFDGEQFSGGTGNYDIKYLNELFPRPKDFFENKGF